MKHVNTTKEGVKMNSQMDFGDTKNIAHEFHYAVSLLQFMKDIEVHYFYRTTPDGFIQLAYQIEGLDEFIIVAQYKCQHKVLKENIIFILSKVIEAESPWYGYPGYQNGAVLSEQELDAIIQALKAKRSAVREEAYKHKTPFIEFLEEMDLSPLPNGLSKYGWRGTCPNSTGKHHIAVSTLNDEWSCGYCGLKGKQADLKKWLTALRQLES